MCGVLGYVSKKQIDNNVFIHALDTLKTRGPDAQGVFQTDINDQFVTLGHQRLAVIDLDQAANQPMVSEDNNFAIVFNGEIYNHVSLRKELEVKGYHFKTKSDTEVLLKGFIEYNSNIVEHIEGMFAFVAFDKKKAKLTLARDHFGKKPLYYCLNHSFLAFASETKALLKFPLVKNSLGLDALSLVKYLLFGYIPAPNSIFKEIKKLEPATVVEFNLADWRFENRKQYWKTEDISLSSGIKESTAEENLELLLNQAVAKRLMADVPLGVFLSGGIDSSLVTALAKKHLQNIDAFTVIYENNQASELAFAQETSKYLNVKLNPCCLKQAILPETIEEILNYLSEPIADPAIVPLLYLAKQAKTKITVALSGDGGDEVFAGYPKYQAQVIAEKLQGLKSLINVLERFLPKNSFASKALAGIELPFPARQLFYGSGGFSIQEVKNLLNLETLDLEKAFAEAEYYYRLFKQNDLVNKCLYLDSRLELPDWYLAKNDQASAASSLEIRSPLLDKSLMEFSLGLEKSFKLKAWQSKYLLKKVAAKYLPERIIQRKKKGFQLPLKSWLNHYSFDLNDLLGLGVLEQKQVLALKKNLAKGIYNSDTKMWRLIVLNSFVRNYL